MKVFILVLAISTIGCVGDRMASCIESCNRMVQACHGADCKALLDTCYTQCNIAWGNVPNLPAEQDWDPLRKKP